MSRRRQYRAPPPMKTPPPVASPSATVMVVTAEPVPATVPPAPVEHVWTEEDAQTALKAMKVEQSWVPPCITIDGVLVVNLPRGEFKELTGLQLLDILKHRHELEVEILQADDVCKLLGIRQ